MAEKMMAYIESQPAVWRHILSESDGVYPSFSKNVKRVFIVGSGSSYNAGLCAQKLFEEQLGLETTVVIPTGIGAKLAVVKLAMVSPEETMVLVVSQSGRSTNTLAAVHDLQAAGFQVTSITANAASPLAAASDAHILIDCGDETVGPKTVGMTSTVLTLYLVGMAYALSAGTLSREQAATLRASFNASFDAAAENIRRSTVFCEAHMDCLSSRPHFTLISDGTGYPVAIEDALKVLETLYVPAFAYEFEEYLHGVNNTIAPDCCNILIPTHKANAVRMQTLSDYSAVRGCINFMVTTLDVAGESQGTHILTLLGSGSPYTAIFETMLFFQVFSTLGSQYKGINCDKPKFSDFYDVMETKAH